MTPTNPSVPFLEGIERHVAQRDIDLQLRYSRWRRGVRRALESVGERAALPPLFPEYFKMLTGSMIGFWIIAWFAALAHVPTLWTYLAFGVLYAGQATWYGHKLAEDPTFRIPRCGCAGKSTDNAESVLSSTSSRLLGVPNAMWALLLYFAMGLLLIFNQDVGIRIVALGGVVASGVLAVVMVARLRALCTTCVNMAAINLLLLWQVMR